MIREIDSRRADPCQWADTSDTHKTVRRVEPSLRCIARLITLQG